MHRLCHATVRRCPCGCDLSSVTCIASRSRHLHHETDPGRHRHRVLSRVFEARVEERALDRSSRVHDAIPPITLSRLVDLGRGLMPVLARQALPFDRQRTVALQVPERSVVAEHVEAVLGALPRPSGLVAPVGPVPDARAEQLLSLVGDMSRRGEKLVIGRSVLAYRPRPPPKLALWSKSTSVTSYAARAAPDGDFAASSSTPSRVPRQYREQAILGPRVTRFRKGRDQSGALENQVRTRHLRQR